MNHIGMVCKHLYKAYLTQYQTQPAKHVDTVSDVPDLLVFNFLMKEEVFFIFTSFTHFHLITSVNTATICL